MRQYLAIAKGNAYKDNAPASSKGAIGTLVDNTISHITGPDLITGKPKDIAAQKAAALAYSRQGLSTAEVSGPSGLATPQAGFRPYRGNHNLRVIFASAVQGGVYWPATQAAKSIGTQLQQLGYIQYNGSAILSAAVAPQMDLDRAKKVSDYTKDYLAGLIPLTNEIDRLSKEVNASRIAGAVTSGLKDLGFTDQASARAQLNKDLGLVQGTVVQNAGSDTRAAEILKGYPHG